MAICSKGCPEPVSGGWQADAPIPNAFSESTPETEPAPVFWCDTHKDEILSWPLGEGRFLTEDELLSL